MTTERLVLTAQAYDPARGAVADAEGGVVKVDLTNDGVMIAGDSAGLRDPARWCLVIADESAPAGSHIHLDPRTTPLSAESLPLVVTRHLPGTD